ncbi:MAG: beta-phosphoglucomutase [Bacillota bacterium]
MNKIKAVIFDLDGVIVTTDECHYKAWRKLADEEGIYFDRGINERLRGVSRMDSLEILLEKSPREYSREEKELLAERKNGYYREYIGSLTPADILPGMMEIFHELRRKGLKIAVGSSSKNAATILNRIGLAKFFDCVVDGSHIVKSKPDPEIFLKIAFYLKIPPENCLVVEDADAGIEAALAGGMQAAAVGAAADNPKAAYRAVTLYELPIIKELLRED